MKKFTELTKFIEIIEKDKIGEFVFDNESKGTWEDPIEMTWFRYSEMSLEFIDAVYEFDKANNEYELHKYVDILKRNGISLEESLKNVDVSDLDAQCVLALIMSIIRGDRFCEGLLASYLKSGCIVKWLGRLKELDE